MTDALRRILYPAFVATIVATLWAMGDAQAKADQAYNRRYWPPIDPAMFDFADTHQHADPEHGGEPDAYFEASSLDDY